MKQAIFTFLFVFLPILASADPVEIDGIYYNLENEAKTAEVTKMPTAINSLKEYSPTYPVGIYSIDGKRLQKAQRGLNIIRMNDGKTIKRIVK
jgi:hypothetical protein